MADDRELGIAQFEQFDECEGLLDAVDLASDQGQVTWLTDGGKRIAAIVPVDLAGHALRTFLP